MLIQLQDLQYKIFGYGLSLVCLWISWGEYVRYGFSQVFYCVILIGVLWTFLIAKRSLLLRTFMSRWMIIVFLAGGIFAAVIFSLLVALMVIPAFLMLRAAGKKYMRRQWGNGPVKNVWLNLPANDDHRRWPD